MPSAFQQGVEPQLIEQARGGDMEAHARLFQIFGGSVYNLASRILNSREAADDVLQETFLEVLRNVSGYRGSDAEGRNSLGFWIRRIAINKCLMHLRSGWERLRDERVSVELVDVAAHANTDAMLDIEKALARLPATTRAVVWLHDVEGLTHEEIATQFGKSISFSKSQLCRAHSKLKTSLQHEVSIPCMPISNNC